LVYRAYQGGERTERVFAPYCIEPSGVGFSCYAIGLDELRGQLRTLKLDRIHEARLTDERFTLPESFDPYALLASAWGVVWADDAAEALEEVQLRFSPRVVRRVKEST
jgi:proteasome accessory factor B